MVTFKFLKIIHPSFAKSAVKLLSGLSVLSEPKIFEENVLWCFYTPVGLRDCCPCTSSHSFLLSPANGAWCALWASHTIYIICTGRAVPSRRKQFVVFLESAFNLRTMSFRTEAGGAEEVTGPSLGRGGRREKELPRVSWCFWSVTSNSSRKQNSRQVFLELIWLIL